MCTIANFVIIEATKSVKYHRQSSRIFKAINCIGENRKTIKFRNFKLFLNLILCFFYYNLTDNSIMNKNSSNRL